MRYLVTAMLAIVAIIHLLPLSGVLGSARLSALYGISFDEPNLAILMRHRAVLFGLLGAFILYAAFRPGYQLAALVAGFVSVLSFLYLAWSTGGYNAQVGRVFAADIVALACLVVGAAAYAYLLGKG
jgi:hypothetical protein